MEGTADFKKLKVQARACSQCAGRVACVVLSACRLQELRNELQARGLDTTGTKQVLLDRLEAAVATSAKESAPESTPVVADAQPHAGSQLAAVAAVRDACTRLCACPLLSVHWRSQSDAAQAKAQPAPMSEEEKRKLRAERFGIPLVTAATDDAQR